MGLKGTNATQSVKWNEMYKWENGMKHNYMLDLGKML